MLAKFDPNFATFRDKELKSEDWMFIPQGTKYTMKIGPMGAVMCYCYCCCYVRKRLHKGRKVVSSDPFRYFFSSISSNGCGFFMNH